MQRLSALQGRMHAHVVAGDGRAEGDVVGDERASAAFRLGIYVHAYRARLVEVLGDDFPALAASLGPERFAAMAAAYVDAHPSHHPSVRWFGRALAGFLADTAPWRAEPALAQIARFEWAQGEMTDAPDDPTIGIEAMAAVAPERWPHVRLRLRAALRRLDLEWNVAAVVHAVAAGEPTPTLERSEGPVGWVLWRDGLTVRWRSLDADERDALDACRAGTAFAAICETVAGAVGAEAAPLRAAGFLKQWLSDGLVAALALDDAGDGMRG